MKQKETRMGDKWDEIEELLKDVVVKDFKNDPKAMGNLIKAICKIVEIVRRLDERYGGCEQKAEWKLYSRCGNFVSYSCTAHLSLMVGTQTDYVNALDIDVQRDCCYAE